ncbi:alpha/beta hydrolase family protein [Legionella israelensis]|uniref:Alpha/beta hydrolase n=1 Tax=Legionella israelensis TaxID=454 RepID=A0A0W0VNC0_9GAMM|nr:hypothetical protein [Legionella israelensis]KTD21544.1 hypothetical protein Lisr_1535 [Legionella israelensis]QBS09125.1 hypothetical protein E4T55_04220 [Legionella israelensis]SCY51718.1 hypothetical protein SAMN02746069_02717 [Legionella israelensis DSM 19235]STX58856.1 Uncharacterised protein [Legionella israelensis]
MINCFLWRTTFFIVAFGMFSAFNPAQSDELPVKLVKDYTTFMKLAKSPLADMPKAKAWKKAAPKVQSISIKSSADGSLQPALFYDSGSLRKKPLLLVLHSWSANYMQHFSIPYGVWAVENDWVFIHPNFRGDFDNPEAGASELAIQDVLDALEYAKKMPG